MRSDSNFSLRVSISPYVYGLFYFIGVAVLAYSGYFFYRAAEDNCGACYGLGIVHVVVSLWILFNAFSAHYIEYVDRGLFLQIRLGPGGYWNCFQSCCSCANGSVQYSQITEVLADEGNCCDGALINMNRATQDWVYLPFCCSPAVGVRSTDTPCCCHSGYRKLGVTNDSEVQELRTFLESKLSSAPIKLLPQWKCCDVFVYVMI